MQHDLKPVTRSAFLFYLPPLLFLALIAIICVMTEIPPYYFMRDPSTIANISSFVGVVSNMGVLLMCASAAICLFTWLLFRKQADGIKDNAFLLYSGLYTMLLFLDDMFLIHEKGSKVTGISEKLFFLCYGLILLTGIFRFRDTILKTKYKIIVASISFLFLSLIFDALQQYIELVFGHWRIFFEDGFKFLGLFTWAGYYVCCCYDKTKNLIPASQAFTTDKGMSR